ncbi:hypothetical protein ARNL5_02333 [Anaerolineae bacterium]|nr:hypothetical protein ARNL5_02333 [Anaerolineae bacterium]
MAQKKARKKKRRPVTSSGGSAPAPTGGGILQSMRSSVRRVAGVEEGDKKPSTLSNVIWGIVLAALAGFAIYRWFFQDQPTAPAPAAQEERAAPADPSAPPPSGEPAAPDEPPSEPPADPPSP